MEKRVELGDPLNFYLKSVRPIQVSLHSRLRFNVQNEAQMKLFPRSRVPITSTFLRQSSPRLKLRYISQERT